jgi:hypothetical protein
MAHEGLIHIDCGILPWLLRLFADAGLLVVRAPALLGRITLIIPRYLSEYSASCAMLAVECFALLDLTFQS